MDQLYLFTNGRVEIAKISRVSLVTKISLLVEMHSMFPKEIFANGVIIPKPGTWLTYYSIPTVKQVHTQTDKLPLLVRGGVGARKQQQTCDQRLDSVLAVSRVAYVCVCMVWCGMDPVSYASRHAQAKAMCAIHGCTRTHFHQKKKRKRVMKWK